MPKYETARFKISNNGHTPEFFCYLNQLKTGLHSAVGNVSGYRCESDCKSRGCEFDPCPVPYFHGD